MLKSFTILDDLSAAPEIGIEVQVEFEERGTRWCYFMIPRALSQCGDILPHTDARISYAPHMIVVSHISEHIIKEALHFLDAEGDLEFCTRAYGDVGRFGKPDIRENPLEYDADYKIENEVK